MSLRLFWIRANIFSNLDLSLEVTSNQCFMQDINQRKHEDISMLQWLAVIEYLQWERTGFRCNSTECLPLLCT